MVMKMMHYLSGTLTALSDLNSLDQCIKVYTEWFGETRFLLFQNKYNLRYMCFSTSKKCFHLFLRVFKILKSYLNIRTITKLQCSKIYLVQCYKTFI